MSVQPSSRPCSVCGEPLDEATAHWLHEPGCPGPFEVACACDIWVHPECCPECQITY